MKKSTYLIIVFLVCISTLNKAISGDIIECNPENYNNISYNSVTTAIFSPDGQYILSGHTDKTIKLWNVTNFNLIQEFEHGELDWHLRVAFSPDMKMIASSGNRCNSKIIKIWDIASGKIKNILHTSSEVLLFSNSSKQIITESNACLNQWGIESGKIEKKFIADKLNFLDKCWNISIGSIASGMFKKRTDRVRDSIITPEGKHIICAVGNIIKIFNINNPNDSFIFVDDENILKIIVSKNSKYLLYISDSKMTSSNSKVSPLKLWDILNKKLIREIYIEKKYEPLPHSMSFTPDGNKIIIGLWNYLIIIYDFQTANIHNTVKLKARPHVFSPNGKLFLSIGKKLDLWETMTGKHVRTLWSEGY